ncbi:MAG: uroporphyrinogen decarboxylase family protein [Fimbriimonas sp.]|nr:uroporphyrinogen decarboxylase family protein [Fimbriimonas sp.]
MNKREALLRYLEGDRVGEYTPAAFFLHFGDDYKLGEAAIQRHKEFFAATDMDFVKIQFELGVPQLEISRDTDFERIPYLPLVYYKPQLEVVKGLVTALKSEAHVVLTLYSPFMLLGNMVGRQILIDHMERSPEMVFRALETVTESLLEFVRECVRIGLDGFYHSTQGGESHRFMDPDIFQHWIKPTDHLVMNEIDETCNFNILHICDYHQEFGGYNDLSPFVDYPGTVVNVSTEIGGASVAPSYLSQFFERPYMGGLNRLGVLANGTEAEARAAARKVLDQAPPRFILGADCTVPPTTPWSNLRAAVDEAHGIRP